MKPLVRVYPASCRLYWAGPTEEFFIENKNIVQDAIVHSVAKDDLFEVEAEVDHDDSERVSRVSLVYGKSAISVAKEKQFNKGEDPRSSKNLQDPREIPALQTRGSGRHA